MAGFQSSIGLGGGAGDLVGVMARLLSLGRIAAAGNGGSRQEPLALKFSEFFSQPVGPRGLEFHAALWAAQGRWVRLVGYIVVQEQPQAGRFLLAPQPVRLSEHADGDADDLPPATVTVLLDASQRDRIVARQPGPVALIGQLAVGREEDSAGRVSWLRLHLPRQALASEAASLPTQ
ncbi:MAG: hypothetical protein HY021_00245 [Burkholderiales bacterium]|nr:hypothetical protein [Burkholderiales bacterium]